MMQRFEAILLFYRPLFIWSFAVNVLIIIVNPHVFTTVITKLLLTIFVWYLINETNRERKLIFYKNLGISTFKLFSAIFLIDVFITIGFLLIMQEFI